MCDLVLGAQGRLGDRRLGRQRRAALPGTQLSDHDRRHELAASCSAPRRRASTAAPTFNGSPYDVAGVYGAGGAGGAVGVGAQVITLRNEKGAVLNLSGRQVGLQINADLSGLAISMR